eukprot:1610390-Rhodomonas_salina.2
MLALLTLTRSALLSRVLGAVAEQIKSAAEALQERARTSLSLSTAGLSAHPPNPSGGKANSAADSAAAEAAKAAEGGGKEVSGGKKGADGKTQEKAGIQPLVPAPAFKPSGRKRGEKAEDRQESGGADLWWGISPPVRSGEVV